MSGNGKTFGYDSNGNLAEKVNGADTWTYEWDAENRLTEVLKNTQTVATLAYDPLGRRVEKVVGGITTTFTYDLEDILRETIGATSTYYVHGPRVDEPLAKQMSTYYHADALGSILKLTDGSGDLTHEFRYDAYGEIESGSTQGGYSFTGREWDPELGLYYFRARYYDPNAGRFISEDPIGLMGGANLYGYVRGRPVSSTDPSGLKEHPDGFMGPLPPNGYYSSEMIPTRCGRIPPMPPGFDFDDLFANLREAASQTDPWWFYDQVREGAPWDYKTIDSRYEDFGNWHYGATGNAWGFSLRILQREAGQAQVNSKTSKPGWGDPGPHMGGKYPLPWGGIPPYGDDPYDQTQIEAGFNYYAKCSCSSPW